MPNHEELRSALANHVQDTYSIEKIELGAGGYGVVFDAKPQPGVDSPSAAIKVYRGDPNMRQSFYEEGMRLSQISHPNVIGVYGLDSFESPSSTSKSSTPFIIMERAKCSAADLLSDHPGKGVGVRRAVQIIIGSTLGLEAIHEHGLAHRDVKPPNILLVDDMESRSKWPQLDASPRNEIAKIGDLGIARPSITAMPGITQQEFPPVTLEYMAPEQPYGTRLVDMYGLGVSSFQLLTGKFPIWVPGNNAMIWHKAHNERQPAAMSNADMSKEDADAIDQLQPIVARTLAKDPKGRYQSMAEYREAVLEAMSVVDGKTRRNTKVIDLGPVQPGQPATASTQSAVRTPRYEIQSAASPTLSGARMLWESNAKRGPNIHRRTLLRAGGVLGLLAAAGFGLKEIYKYVDLPVERATPEQVAVDTIAKALFNQLPDRSDGAQSGIILRELAQLNPDRIVRYAQSRLLSPGDDVAFRRRVFLESPAAALELFNELRRENADFASGQLIAAMAAGYTPLNQPNDIVAEKARTEAHRQAGNTDSQFREILTRYNNGTGMRSAIIAAKYPTEAFNLESVAAGHAGPFEGELTTADEIAVQMQKENSWAEAEVIAASVAGKNPALSQKILTTIVSRVIAGGAYDRTHVQTLSDAMAPYLPDAVAEQMQRLVSSGLGDSIIDTTRRMALSLAPFRPEVVAEYIRQNAGNGAAIVALALGRSLPDFIDEIRPLTRDDLKIWLDVAKNPLDEDLRDRALDDIERDGTIKSIGGMVGGGLIASRRFAASA